ncbi:hypothetical protein BBJ28_00015016 [Nothophytophthora sp. Chile5]|nr:hypothetical protein BBJ28_00015016 [Nothophytophthora sp. Chile5]
MKTIAGFLGWTLFLAVEGRPTFVARIPNGDAVSGVAALGHANSAGGGALNAFGEAFDSAGRQWTTALCQEDSDGDGATNGEELGDPCCTWTASGGFSGSSSIAPQSLTHPGVATTFTSAQLAAMACGGEADLGLGSAAADGTAASSAALPTSDAAGALSSTASASSSTSTSTSTSTSGSGRADDLTTPEDRPSFPPLPVLERPPPAPTTSSATNEQRFLGAAWTFSISTALLLTLFRP